MDKIKLIFAKGEKEVGLKVTSTKLKNLFLEKFAETSIVLKHAKINKLTLAKKELFGALNPNASEAEQQDFGVKIITELIESGELTYDDLIPEISSTIEEIQKDDEIYVDIFKSIIDDKNFTTNEKSEMSNVEFWENQDLIMIRSVVDSFRTIFKI